MRQQRLAELYEMPERISVGIQLVFNGDWHNVEPELREEWIVRSKWIIDHVDTPDECTAEEIAELDSYLDLVFGQPTL